MTYARIIGTGGYLPEKIMTNHDLEAIVDTSDQWIRERTGIEQRHIAGEGETTVDLAEKASRQAIEAAGIDASEIDLIVLATSTPDKIFPSSACILQARLDIHGCPAFDLVVGAEVFSRILNWEDRTTCVLFGDGAGAVVLEASEETGILSTHIHADGKYENLLWVPHGIADGFEEVKKGKAYVEMRGNEVFKMAVNTLGRIVDETLAANRMMKSDIDWLVPHQANTRIISATARKLHFRYRQETEDVDGPGGGYRQQARKHLGRLGSAGARCRGPRRAHQAERTVAAGSLWRRFYLGFGFIALLGRLPGE
jgi:3-oxoacyl-[acyl-carrier-protein] synthase-3